MRSSHFHRIPVFSFIVLGSVLAGGAVPPAKTPPTLKPVPTATPAKTKPTFERDVAPVVKQYCLSCHGAASPAAGISLADLRAAAVLKLRGDWELVAQNVESGHMPPKGKPAPTRAQRDRLVEWIQTTQSAADCDLKDPGHMTLHRLNRAEYNNTIRDLVGVDFQPAADFPSDDVGYGFDNIGDVLSISPLLIDKYFEAAEQIVNKAIVVSGAKTVRFDENRLDGDEGGDGVVLLGLTGSTASVEHEFPKDGDYLLRIRAFGQQFGPEPPRMSIRLNGKQLRRVDVTSVRQAPQNFDETISVKAGRHKLAAAYTNNLKNDKAPDPKDRGDRNLFVEYFEITGPLGMPELTESHKRIVFQQPTAGNNEETARVLLRSFASRAYRRPAKDDEVERLLRHVKLALAQGESFEHGMRLAVQAALTSPHFLFRVESDPPVLKTVGGKKIGLLDNHQLATRLSYFLWSSMPDDELTDRAARGVLHDGAELEKQVRRMLKDDKAQALADNFASQWLTLRNLDTAVPDPDHFPNFNDALRDAMRQETALFFQDIVRDDRSIINFLDANYSFLNEPLAKHYGIEGVTGDEFRRVVFDAMQAGRRGGLLTQASVLTVTSNPTRTSPVKRGKWVLETILGTPPPPPPPNVPELAEEKKAGATEMTVRQRLQEHRKNPACANCHARMDGIGFGLENYDATGVWRTKDGSAPLDVSGTLASGESFRGPAQLKTILKSKKTEFAAALSAKLLTYALGRGLENADKCVVQDIAKATIKNDYRFSAMVLAIVKSDPFLKRRATAK